jgi:3-deoxy-D-manno-octulosonic-acid transferase
MSAPLSLRLYALATALAAPAAPWWLRRRTARGKELAERWRERLGETTLPAAGRPTVWCHAASVGETASLLPLIDALTGRGHAVVLTTGTVTSARLARERLAAGAVHQFAPLDHRPWLARFIDHWRPGLALRVESDIWPNTLDTLRARGVPVVQVNARLSAAAAARWSWTPGLARAAFGALELVLAQSEADRARFARLGAPRCQVAGNLKLALPPLPHDAAALAALRAAIGERPLWLAASIHPGEDAVVAQAHTAVTARHPGALLIAVPRHAERGAEMAAGFAARGLRAARRSRGEAIDAATDVYVADTMGELGLLYRLARVVMMGKTYAVGGGQNPVEPAQLGCALIWGPDMSNFADIAAALERAGAALRVPDPAGLGAALAELLADGPRRARMAEAARAELAAGAEALPRTLAALAPYLDRLVLR